MDSMKKGLDFMNKGINRAVQKTNEAFGRAEKTEFDEDYNQLVLQTEALHETTKKLLDALETWINPSLTRKLDDAASKLETLVTDQKTYFLKVPAKLPVEQLGDALISAAMDVSTTCAYGDALKKCGDYARQIAALEKKRNSVLEKKILSVFYHFIAVEWEDAKKERKQLESLRLDYDNLRYKLKGVDNPEPKARADLDNAKKAYETQLETTRSKLEKLKSAYISNLTALKEFVTAEKLYLDECKNNTDNLLVQLERQ